MGQSGLGEMDEVGRGQAGDHDEHTIRAFRTTSRCRRKTRPEIPNQEKTRKPIPFLPLPCLLLLPLP